MSSPYDTIKEMNNELEFRNDLLKNEIEINNELTIYSYVLVAFLLVIAVISIKFYIEKEQAVIDVADRQHKLDKWEDFNKSFIPETALPRVHEIEAIYNEERK